ncbi:mucin-3A-like isoform X2 [Lithobates pipiens]
MANKEQKPLLLFWTTWTLLWSLLVPFISCQAIAPCESKRCPCPQYLYGKNCMFIQDDIRLDKVIAKLAVTVHVENVIFTPELEDTTSQAYQTFQKRFIEEIKPFYNSKISNFKDVKINKARNGSIVVDHEVLLTVNFRNYMEETKQTEQLLLRYLKEAICTSSSPDKLCFRVNTSTVTAKEVSLTELCSEDEAIPEEMKMYFHGLNETTFLLCMTECSENNESPINCNWGMCSTSAAGSNCNCDISDEYWYTGSHCETPISKPGVIAGVTVGLIILVIIIMVLVIAFCWRRRVADNETLLEDGGNKHWYGFGWKRNLNIQGKCWNPNMDSKMFGPNGSFRSTKEVNVNPQEKMHIPRPRVIS